MALSGSMRRAVGKGKGGWIKDPKDAKGRAMRRVRDGEGDYEVQSEGIDSDGDGRYNEDGIGGLDLHRNYPENWRPMREETGRGQTQVGAGDYPLSEPETRAVYLFLMTHPNIAIVNSLDTAVPMVLRGPSTSTSAETMFPADLALIRTFDAKGLEITGYPWAGDTYEVYATRGGVNPITGEPARPTPLFGHGPDFGYSSYGVVWYGNEIWNGGRFTDYDKDGRYDEWEVLRWNDENRAGKGDFKEWTAFTHPALGAVEIGGFNPKFYGAESSARSARDVGEERGAVQPVPGAAVAAGPDRIGDVHGLDGSARNRGVGDQRGEDADRARRGQAGEDGAAGHLHDHAGQRAGARPAGRGSTPAAARRRNRLAEARRDETGHVAGEGCGDGEGRDRLDAGRNGFASAGIEMTSD